jgi:hypothetical protein
LNEKVTDINELKIMFMSLQIKTNIPATKFLIVFTISCCRNTNQVSGSTTTFYRLVHKIRRSFVLIPQFTGIFTAKKETLVLCMSCHVSNRSFTRIHLVFAWTWKPNTKRNKRIHHSVRITNYSITEKNKEASQWLVTRSGKKTQKSIEHWYRRRLDKGKYRVHI